MTSVENKHQVLTRLLFIGLVDQFWTGQFRPLFCLFSSFSHSNINYNSSNSNWKRHRWCAWDSNLGPLGCKRRRNHRARYSARQVSDTYLCSNCRVLTCDCVIPNCNLCRKTRVVNQSNPAPLSFPFNVNFFQFKTWVSKVLRWIVVVWRVHWCDEYNLGRN